MNIGTLTVTLGVNAAALDIAAAKMSDFAKRTNAVNQRIRTIGYLTSAVITAPMVAAGRAAFNMAKDYEFSMQRIVGLTGTSQEVVDRWGDSIKNMAREFGKSPKEISDALYFIASSGIATSDALEVLRVSIKAAAAGLGESSDVANYLTSVLNAYRGTGITAAYATDVLVAAVREGKAEAQGFAAAMGAVIPVASKLGVSIDQVAGAMAAITLTGSTASQSGVYLKNIFNALYKEADKGQKAMTAASLALDGMNTSYADLRKILKDQGVMALVEKIRVLTGEYGETLVAQVFPEIRAMTGMMSLMGKNFAYNNSIMKEITESSGALATAFNAVSQTIKIRYDKAMQSTNISLIEFGKSIASALIPLLERFAKWLDKVVTKFDALTEKQKQLRLIVAGLIAAMGPLLLLISSLGYGFTGIVSLGGRLIKVVTGLARGLGLTAISAAAADAALVGTAAAGEAAAAGAAAAGAATAAAGTAIGTTMTSLVAFTGAVGAFGLAVWLVVENAIKPLIKKIKTMRDEYKETMALIEGTDIQMELDASISAKRWDIGKLSKEGLESLKIDIQQRLALEREDLDNARIVNEEKLKEEKGYQDKLEAIRQRQKDWEWVQETSYGGVDLKNAFFAYQEDMQRLEQERDNYVKQGMQMAAQNKIDAEAIIGYYEKVAVEVETALKKLTDPIAQAEEELERLKQQSEEVNLAFFDLMIGEAGINRMLSLLGGSYDDLSEKTQLYKGILERLIEIEAKAGHAIPWVTEKINELVEKLSDLEQIKLSRDLQNIAGLGGILGNSFSANAESADVLKQALIDFNEKTRGTSAAFSAMGIQGKVLQTILDGLTTRWKEYTIASTIEDTDKAVGFAKAQRDAFRTLDSEIEVVSAELEGYKRYMEVLYATNKEGSAEWVIMAERIKELQFALQELQGAGKIAPLEAMASTFGRFEDKISLANTQMDLAKDRMDLLVSQGKAFTDEYYKAADTWAYFKNTVASLQDANIISFAKDMANAFEDTSHYIDLIDAKIEVLTNRMRDLSEMKPSGWEEELKKIAGEIDKLSRKADILSTFESAFTDLFTISKDKFEDFGSWMVGWLTSLGESLSRILAEFVAKKLVGTIAKALGGEGQDMAEVLTSIALGKAKSYEALAISVAEAAKMGYPALLATIPTAVATVVSALGAGAASAAAISSTATAPVGFKEGGVVPAGFPNDTFPAMLTSGEIILPPDKASTFADQIVNKKKKEKEAALQIPHMQHGGVIPAGFPNDSYPALLSSGETVIPPKKLDFTGMAYGFKAMQESMAGAIRQSETLGDRIHNFFADLATGVLTMGFQFRKPRPEELEAGRGSWGERVPLLSEAATWGMLDEMTGKLTSLIPDAVKAVKNMPGLGKAAPDLGYHALLDKNHWAWNPKKLMTETKSVKDVALLYAEATANRLTPLIKKTPLVNIEKRLAEVVMEYGGNPTFSYGELAKMMRGERMPLGAERTYTGSGGIFDYGRYTEPSDPRRSLIKLYLYGDETGFTKAGDDVIKIPLDRYKKLYPDAKAYMMESQVPHGKPIYLSDLETYGNFPEGTFTKRALEKTFPLGTAEVNPIRPIDDISGHLVKLIEIEKGKASLITQDIWKFNPADYVKRWALDTDYGSSGNTLYSSLNAEKQAGILDKLGKPFYLVQNNPILDEVPMRSPLTEQLDFFRKQPSEFSDAAILNFLTDEGAGEGHIEIIKRLTSKNQSLIPSVKFGQASTPKVAVEFDAAALRAKIEKMTETDWDDYLKKSIGLPEEVSNNLLSSVPQSRKAVKEAVQKGNEWSEMWWNNPETKKRIADFDKFERERYIDFVKRSSKHPGSYYKLSDIDRSSTIATSASRMQNQIDEKSYIAKPYYGKANIFENDAYAGMMTDLWFAGGAKKPGTYGAYVNPKLKTEHMPGVAAHEGTHTLFTPMFMVRDFINKLFTDAFEGTNAIANPMTKIGQDYAKVWGTLSKKQQNLMKQIIRETKSPTEVYARISEIRMAEGLLPGQEVTSEMMQSIYNKGLQGEAYPMLDPAFFQLMKPESFRKLINMLPTTVGLTAGGLALSSHEAAAKEVEGGPGRKYPEVFKIIDQRDLDAITGQPVSPYSKLHGTLDLSFVEEVVRKALERGIDPYTALAIPHQETGGTPSGSENPYAVTYTGQEQLEKLIADPIGASLDILKEKLKLADKLGYDTYAKMVQVYNGMGKLTQGAIGGNKAYGIEIPEEGIRMKENPLYGRRVEDVRNNILMQNEELVSFIENLMKEYSAPTLPDVLFKEPEPIEYISGIEGDLTPTILAFEQLMAVLHQLDSQALATAMSTDALAIATANEEKPSDNLKMAGAQGIGNVVNTAIQGGNVGRAAISSIGSLLPSLLAFIPGIGPFLQMLLGGVGSGIFSGLASKMAKGGLVPAGYPNDSFPALLSSGEAVIPLSRHLSGIAPVDRTDLSELRFRIEGDDLVAIYDKRKRVRSKF